MADEPIDPGLIAESIGQESEPVDYRGLDDRALDAAIEAQRQRRDRARAEAAAADTELGRIFAVVISERRDLKAKALRAGVSRQTAYTLAQRSDAD